MKLAIRNYKLKNIRARLLGAACCIAAISGAAQAQMGGTYRIEQSVIAAGGGQNSTGGTFALDGTVGQATTGQNARGATYSLNAGFWTPTGFAPTAAGVTLGGRVTTADGRGILNVQVTLTGASGATRTAITSSFGFYSFADVAAGETYIVSVAAKRFSFAQNMQVHSAIADDASINFIADIDPNTQAPWKTMSPN